MIICVNQGKSRPEHWSKKLFILPNLSFETKNFFAVGDVC